MPRCSDCSSRNLPTAEEVKACVLSIAHASTPCSDGDPADPFAHHIHFRLTMNHEVFSTAELSSLVAFASSVTDSDRRELEPSSVGEASVASLQLVETVSTSSASSSSLSFRTPTPSHLLHPIPRFLY